MPSQLQVVNAEPIYAALFALLQQQLQGSPPTFVTVGRRHVSPDELGPAQQPALFSIGVGAVDNPRPEGTPGKVTLKALLIVYAFGSALNQPPGEETELTETVINNLILAVRTALAPAFPNGGFNRQTLGGLVRHCWIEGEVSVDPGVYGQQAAALIPVHILVP
jgi:hypothetical protein